MYRPQGDTFLLADALRDAAVPPRPRILDLCTGTGALAVTAASMVADARVTAVDVSARAVLSAHANARLRGVRIRALRGDLFTPVSGEKFDVVLANPPYVLSPTVPDQRRHTQARAWDAGVHGRTLLDRICARAPAALAPGGMLLMVHSALCSVEASLQSLRAQGLKASVIARRPEPFGPVMRSRRDWLEAHGFIKPGQAHEELVVIRADRPEPQH